MAEYIEREAAMQAFLAEKPDAHYPGWYAGLLEEIPAADVAPVVHGRWVSPHWNNSNYCCNCSECGGEAMHKEYRWNSKGIYPICPKCGARMDGEVDVD
jgi:hypothetical protein